MQKRNKITVIGAGNVGATVAQKILEMRLGDVALVDMVDGLPQGKGLDLLESAPIVGISGDIVGTNTYEETAGSDLIIITAGMARKPGMIRDDLLAANVKIVSEVTKAAAPLSPDAKIIVVTNPMDVMAYVAWKVSGFSKERVIGMGGVLTAQGSGHSSPSSLASPRTASRRSSWAGMATRCSRFPVIPLSPEYLLPN